jgi:hypothetical protein
MVSLLLEDEYGRKQIVEYRTERIDKTSAEDGCKVRTMSVTNAHCESVILLAMNPRAVASVVVGLWVAALLGGCVAPALSPTAAFTFNPSVGESPLIVTFDASGSQSPSTTITGYLWDFGDGSAGQGMITAHAYRTDAERTFNVLLTVTDRLGQQASSVAHITVRPPIIPPETASVEFVWPFHYNASGDDAANLNDEYFTLQNTGHVVADLSGWTVENDSGAMFRFPSGIALVPGEGLTVYSGSGTNSQRVLYWHADQPVWSDASDLAILRDRDGTIIDFYAYNSC